MPQIYITQEIYLHLERTDTLYQGEIQKKEKKNDNANYFDCTN